MPRAATESGPAPAAPARGLPAAATELLLAVVVTLGCFSGFLALLEVAFPKGQSLHSLLAAQVESVTQESTDPGTVDVPAARSLASLAVLRRSVLSRPAGAITWSSAATGLALNDGDGVQTGAEGRAQIAFGDAVRLELENNTLVVVSDPEEGAALTSAPERPRGVIIAEGELWARMQSGSQEQVAITLPNATAALGGRPNSKAAVQLLVRPDGQTTVAVKEGKMALKGSGPAMDIGPGQYVRVARNGTVSAPLPLPKAPNVDGPDQGAAFGYLDLPPQVPFHWRAVDGIRQYRVRAARDPAFKQVVFDEIVSQPSLTWGRLQPGTYYWQVTGIVDDVDGAASPVRSLTVRNADARLDLEVAAPRVEHLRCVVRGHAALRAKVFVMGRRVETKHDGTFQTEIELARGANILLVEAVDAAGHSTYWSQVVHAKP